MDRSNTSLFRRQQRVIAAGRGALAALAIGAAAAQASAADGCLVMLCLAAPSWSSIPQCIDPVRQVLRDIARGRPFPSCPDAKGSSAAANHWASAPAYCPPQYTLVYELFGSMAYACVYDGAIEVDVNGVLWARTWWNLGGDSVTEFTPTAKASMRDWNTRFEDDYAHWVATQPPAPCTTC